MAMIEMAAASGLALVPREQRNPLLTTSYGTGELILAALDAGARHLILGLGGSATNDGGAGMLQALGVQLLDAHGQSITRGGAALAQLARMDASGIDQRLAACTIDVACDVDNPLTGPAALPPSLARKKAQRQTWCSSWTPACITLPTFSSAIWAWM